MNNIMWQYLDKKSATISALKDYSSMQFIIESTDENIIEARERMVSVGSPVLTDMPKGPHNPQANEDRIVESLNKIDLMHERLNKALAYMEWFKPAWQMLSDDERFVLETYYCNDGMKQIDHIYDICDRLNIERSSAYNKKNRALKHLVLLLYGG